MMSDGMKPSDEDERASAAARGDRAAAAAILAELLPRARNLVRYLVRGDSEVDDMAQEALIAVLKGLPGYRAEGSFRAWSDRVIARTTFAYLKRKRAEAAELAEAHAAEAPELIPVPPAGRADDYLSRRDVVRLLDRLPAEQRHAIILHHAVGLSIPEIAADLGAPFDTIKSRIRLGMAALRAVAEENTNPGEVA
jgi:RNA polymerase sigma-70 factor (ECF subfamily)